MTTPARDLILTPPTIPTTVVVAAEVIAQVAAVEQAMTEAPLITDQATFDVVRAVAKQAQTTLRTIDSQRQLAKQPWFAVGKAIDDAARPFIQRCEAVKNEAKSQEEAFLIEQDRLKAEAERARAVAEATAAALLKPGQAPQLSVQVLPQHINAPVARWQEIEVVDPTLVPDDFKVIDWPKVRSYMEIHGDGSIPGIRFKSRVRVVAR
jgi:hypothetical protein